MFPSMLMRICGNLAFALAKWLLTACRWIVSACRATKDGYDNRGSFCLMDNQIDTPSPLWLILAAFALLLIMRNHSLELWKALRRGMQMSARATAIASRLAGKAIVIGMVFAELLLAPLQGHVQSMSPEEQSIWLMYFSDLEQTDLIDKLCRASAYGDFLQHSTDNYDDWEDCMTPIDNAYEIVIGGVTHWIEIGSEYYERLKWILTRRNWVEETLRAIVAPYPVVIYSEPPNVLSQTGEYRTAGFRIPGPPGWPTVVGWYLCHITSTGLMDAIEEALDTDLAICDSWRDREIELAERERDSQLGKLRSASSQIEQ